MLDDAMSGVYAYAVLRLLILVWPRWFTT